MGTWQDRSASWLLASRSLSVLSYPMILNFAEEDQWDMEKNEEFYTSAASNGSHVAIAQLSCFLSVAVVRMRHRRPWARMPLWKFKVGPHTPVYDDLIMIALIMVIITRANFALNFFLYARQCIWTLEKTRSIWKMLSPFATASRRTPPVLILHCHSPGVATVDTTTKMSRSQL